jgi:hypothetical protein
VRSTGLAAKLIPVRLADVLVDLDREAAALSSFAAIESVLPSELNVKVLTCLGIAIPRLTDAP